MKKINWKLIGIVSLWVIGLSATVVSLAFTEVRQQSVLCKKIEININREDENYFINKQDVLKILFSPGDSLIGTPIHRIPVSLLERLLKLNKYVDDADVYIDIKGKLQVNIVQRKPMLRIMNEVQQSFYIDEKGGKMPLSTLYSANVLIANGSITEQYNGINDSISTALVRSLFYLSNVIRADKFWNAQIEQIYIEPNQDIVLIPRLGDHKIIFGDTSNANEKFENLLVFYQKALPKVGWQTYHTINVKFKGQLVCSRRDKAELPVISLNDSLKIPTDTANLKIEDKKL
jgi:cell division protein FtsQ